MEKTKLINFCDRAILFSIYGIAFYLPISKAIIEICSSIAIFCYIIKKIVQRDGITKTKINYAILIYLAICFISIFSSVNIKISFQSFLGKVLQNIALFFAVADTLNSDRRIKNFIYISFLSYLLLGVDGMYQYFTHKEFIRNRPYFEIPRIHATFSSANDYGCYLATAIPFTLSCFFARNNFKKLLRFAFAVLFLLLLTCLMLTVSRGAWFALMVSALFMSIWIRALGIVFLLFGIVIIIAHQFFFPYLKERLQNLFVFFDPSSIDRKMIWQAAWKMIMASPLIGLGLGTFMFNFEKFVVKGYPYSIPYAHNCYLQIAAETGIIGLFSFLSILILFFYYGIRAINTRKKSFSWYILLSSLAAVLSYAVQIGVDTFFYSLDLGTLFWLLLALGAATMKNIELENGKI
ncbi:MAG: O-antigen ligase family protein [Candidatus Omnitrophica bacterium]|nr:O-antigen ligase family protein [Candidatus Omnitrophota bacterium]MDD5238221.1 O-antigen ligase family protein [Candidatus Omnitrophota bacterium]